MDPVAITCSTYTSQMLQDCSVVSEVTVCVQVTLDSQVFTSHETVLVLLSDLRRKHLSYTYKEFSAFQPHLLSYHSAHPRVFSTLLSDSGKNQLDLLSALLQAEHRSQPSNHTSGVCWTCSNLSMPFSHQEVTNWTQCFRGNFRRAKQRGMNTFLGILATLFLAQSKVYLPFFSVDSMFIPAQHLVCQDSQLLYCKAVFYQVAFQPAVPQPVLFPHEVIPSQMQDCEFSFIVSLFLQSVESL